MAADLVIIGAGMAGLSTAIWARRLGLSATVLEREEQAGGQLTAIAGRIVDYPGLSLPDGTALTRRLLQQAREAGVDLRLDWRVESVQGESLRCQTNRGAIQADALVIATGLSARRLEVLGEDELYQHRLVRRPSHDLGWFAGKRVAVIGGGDRAAENGLMLTRSAAAVHLLHRGERLRARPSLAEELLAHPGVTVHLETGAERFTVEGDAVRIAARSAGQPVELTVDGVCIYIGNRPNSRLLQGQVALDPQGYILTDRYGQTSHPRIYAVGDVCTPPAFQSLATAGGQAMAVAKQIGLLHQG